jgi:hypothetical protein
MIQVSLAKKPDGKKKEEDSITISHPTVTHSIHQNHDSVRAWSTPLEWFTLSVRA